MGIIASKSREHLPVFYLYLNMPAFDLDWKAARQQRWRREFWMSGRRPWWGNDTRGYGEGKGGMCVLVAVFVINWYLIVNGDGKGWTWVWAREAAAATS